MAAPLPLDAAWKNILQVRATTANPADKMDATKDSEGPWGICPVTYPWDRTGGSYGDWVHYNYVSQFSRGISNNSDWQKRWSTLVVMPAQIYDAPRRRFGRSFVYVLGAELTGVWQRCWNAERLIVFQTMILQHDQQLTRSGAIQKRIEHWLDACEAGEFGMLAEDTARTCVQYISTRRGEDTMDTWRRSSTA